MTLFYIFDKLVINIVDTHVSIVIILSLFFYGFIPLKLVTKKKMVIITTIRKLIYENGCYYIRVISQIVLFSQHFFSRRHLIISIRTSFYFWEPSFSQEKSIL